MGNKYITTKPNNVKKFIKYLKDNVKDEEYAWSSTTRCAIGYAKDFFEVQYPIEVFNRLGINHSLGDEIYTGPLGAKKCRTRKDAIKLFKKFVPQ